MLFPADYTWLVGGLFAFFFGILFGSLSLPGNVYDGDVQQEKRSVLCVTYMFVCVIFLRIF